ncbi:MAG: bifunctional phosphoribosylaminoimidazolecarboxamide formyltransferase/IMP cyclohydrolase [Chloroherpetonaceae bacterium]|nr:bifunctional phosphoribosylaminoimidazolecarboxamide formyltransferase/IMP cyclohydrolase [Chloroherpetonaceae bacterium]
MNPKIKRALISVSDKTGIIPFAQVLEKLGVEIISTGGTLRSLQDSGINAQSISTLTKFPEILDGRVKTLHPNVHGGLLAKRDEEIHLKEMTENSIEFIDLVVVNLYPFEKTVAKSDVKFDEAIENIDIGGPSMLRSSAKNFKFVTVVTDFTDYATVLDEMQKNNGATTLATRFYLAQKVFQLTSKYDSAISNYLATALPEELILSQEKDTNKIELEYLHVLTKEIDMRYGENPHQKAGFYSIRTSEGESTFREHFEKLHGKELSFNNILDISAAAGAVEEFWDEAPTAVIVKHTNPCGVGQDASLLEAYKKAFQTDTQAPFGGIISVNRSLDKETAEAINLIFTEIVIAPDFEDGVMEMMRKKKDRRIIQRKKSVLKKGLEVRGNAMGILIQERDTAMITRKELKVVTKRVPTEEEFKDLLFAWKVCKHVKSNAIVYAKNLQTYGIGAGQMSRVDSSRIARWKAGEAGLDLNGSAVASDAFFPFADGLLAAAEAGAMSVIQPGGSVRDQEVIDAANEKGIAMVFTGIRHFKH